MVDWPHKAESKSYFPPKGEWNQSSHTHTHTSAGVLTLQPRDDEDDECLYALIIPAVQPFFLLFPGYAFLLFQDESSVQALIDACIQEDGKLYLCVSSPTIKDKPVSAAPGLTGLLCLRVSGNRHA